MHQHPRASPVTAFPAKSPRTNPTRTNNPRDQEPGTSRSSSERNTPSDQGIGLAEGFDVQGRVQDAPSDGKDNLAKLSQVIQVCMISFLVYAHASYMLNFSILELSYKSGLDYPAVQDIATTGVCKGHKHQTSK